jgi:Secretion system C-terminal sorting domain
MKRTLLFLLVPFYTFAQIGFPSFYDFTDINGYVYEDNYVVLTHPSFLDESALGENVIWNFSELSEIATSHTRIIATTDEEEALYPNTDKVAVTRVVSGDNEEVQRLYIGGTPIMETLITGFASSDYSLQYSDNFVIDIFPTGYGFTNTNSVSGIFEINGISGIFTGEAIATSDAYGTLSVNNAPASAVDRITITQNLELFYMNMPVGNLTQTIHYYYNFFSPASGPVFRSTASHIELPTYNIDYNTYMYENYVDTTLKSNTAIVPSIVAVAPNPVNNTLHIAGAEVTGLTIVDAMGRTVLQAQGNDADVSGLSAGVYQVLVAAEGGTKTLKMAKE